MRVKALDLYKVQHAAAGQSHMLVVTQQVRCAHAEGRGGGPGQSYMLVVTQLVCAQR